MIDEPNPSFEFLLDEIEQLRDDQDAEIARLRQALVTISAEPSFDPNRPRSYYLEQTVVAYSACRQIANAAIKENEND